MSKQSMSPPKYKIQSTIECCYTCAHAKHGEGITCPYYWSLYKGRRIHPLLSKIGKCGRFNLREGIGPHPRYNCADNIRLLTKVER